jgi:ribosomal protein S18 acetylase RimI-like enzyme
MNSQYSIRKATVEDLENLVNLFDQYRIFYRKESNVDDAKLFLKERMINHESVVFVAHTDKELVGFVQLYPLFSSIRMQRLWLLNDLFVMESHRNKGISKALLNTCAAFGKETGACGLMLETEKTNQIANQLYVTSNWQLDHEHNYYSLNLP